MDHVATVHAQWRAERPDLDTSPMLVVGRIHRVGAALTPLLVEVFERHGLGEGEFDILATLRRQGEPHALTPGDLAARTMVTSGAVTKRVDRLEARGLVERRPSDRDGRSRMVRLTARGRQVVDVAVTEHVANEHRLLARLAESLGV
ncbi:MAG: MarR family winged helix-turn-helix transcriptional regulator [Phycicoccus sp.]